MNIVGKIANAEEITWINSKLMEWEKAKEQLEITMDDIIEAEQRLERFAPFIMKCFPETVSQNGMIESALKLIPKMQRKMEEKYGTTIPGNLFIKQDSHLAVAGSV